MSVTPAEVRLAAFRLVWRGYATEEVDAFLDRVEQELTRRSAGPSDAHDEVPAAAGPAVRHALPDPASPGPEQEADHDRASGRTERAMTVLQLAEQALQEAHAKARAISEDAAAEAERAQAEAARVRDDARREAERVLAEARSRAESVHDEVAEERRRELAELDRRCTELRSASQQLDAAYLQHRARVVHLLEEQLRRVQSEEQLRIVDEDAVA